MLAFVPVLALLSLASPQETRLSGVEVMATRQSLVTVSVSGNVTEAAIIRSQPVGIRCGLDRYQYNYHAAPRLCWTRQRGGSTITLQAEGAEALGPNWRVEWTGCTPSADGRSCVLQAEHPDMPVRAVFRAN